MKKVFKTAAFLLAMGLMTSTFTSCGEDDENGTDEGTVEEQMKFNNLTAKANADGTITIGGSITTNTKLKEFCLYQEDGTTVEYNFLEENEQVKEKNNVLDDNGKASKEKQFTLDIASKTVPVAIYKLVIKTKKNKEQSETIGEVLTYKIGPAESATSSYLSVVKNKPMTLNDAKANVADVEIIANSTNSGFDMDGIKRASDAKSTDINSACGKVALFDANGKLVEKGGKINGGTIITASGCICKMEAITPSSDASNGDGVKTAKDYTFKGITIKNGGSLKVDVSAHTFSK